MPLNVEDPRALAEEQGALRRVATLVARRAAPEELFAAVTEEIGQLLGVEFAIMGPLRRPRYDHLRRRLGDSSSGLSYWQPVEA